MLFPLLMLNFWQIILPQSTDNLARNNHAFPVFPYIIQGMSKMHYWLDELAEM
jgi:hypothetical protein